MTQKIPAFAKTVIIGDDARLLAQMSSLLAHKGSYLPVLDGPRTTRPDWRSEVIRRNNAVARLDVDAIFFADLPQATCDLFTVHFPRSMATRISNIDEVRALKGVKSRGNGEPLHWGKSRIGIGLLRALRERREIVFDGKDTNEKMVKSKSKHIILCEEGDDHAQVVAANYAYALDASLRMVPAPSDDECNGILESFYSLYDNPGESATSTLERLTKRIRQDLGELDLSNYESATFMTRSVPWGVAFPEIPTTHLFQYPDLGIAIINGLAAERPGEPGIRVAALVDPGQVDAKEIDIAVSSLRERGVFVRGVQSAGASAYTVSRTIELFPYDLFLISTHCGDAPGTRLTYEYSDQEGRPRRLVVDMAVGITPVPNSDKLDVTEFTHFVSLDGVDWTDTEKKKQLYVGSAITDYLALKKNDPNFAPIVREEIGRVVASAALRLYDGNYIPMPRSLASERAPIVINNACASWHRLAGSFVFANARAYVGTLFSISDVEAQEVMRQVFQRHFGKPLYVALWLAQNRVYGQGVRRPYAMVGCHCLRLRSTVSDAPAHIVRELVAAHKRWLRMLRSAERSNESLIRACVDYMKYIRQEVRGIRDRWLAS